MSRCRDCQAPIEWRDRVPYDPGSPKRHWDTCVRRKRSVLVVLDTETTGLKAGHHEVVDVAAMALDPATLECLGTFQSHVAPLYPERATAEAFKTNGLSLDFLADKPDIDTVRREFAGWLGQYAARPIPVGYNLPFDLAHLESWALPPWSYRQVDVLQLVTVHLWLPGLTPDAKLTTATQYLQLTHDAHRAMGDVVATAEILRRFRKVWQMLTDRWPRLEVAA